MKYDFKCTECKHVFEIDEPMSETTPTRECPKCRATANKVLYCRPIHGFRNGPVRVIDPDENWEDRRNRERVF